MCPNPLETADLDTFTEEILKRKLHFLCNVSQFYPQKFHINIVPDISIKHPEGLFSTLSNIYDGAFFAKTSTNSWSLIIFAKKLHYR